MMRAFVLMPFREPFNGYYPKIFRPALESAGFSVQRADDLYSPRPVMLDIQESIVGADLVLCEMSGRNPNVFYELGLAHAIGKPAILVSTTEDDIPFDLRHVRVIHYDFKQAGWEDNLRSAITAAARAAATGRSPWPPPLHTFAAPQPDRDGERQSFDRSDSRVVDRPVNLGFDGPVVHGVPHGWFNSVGYVFRVSDRYVMNAVPRDDGQFGACLRLQNDSATADQFGSAMQRFPASFLAGRVVQFDGFLRARDVAGWAGLWLRADGETMPDLLFDNMSRAGLSGTLGWQRCMLEASLPADTAWLNIGVVLAGAGVVWADNCICVSGISQGRGRTSEGG